MGRTCWSWVTRTWTCGRRSSRPGWGWSAGRTSAGADIKHGTLEALGWPHASQADVARGWQRILATVRSYKDLEPSLLGRMEELIDFVTAPGTR